MRYRPMPSAPRSRQCSTSYGKLDVAQQLDPHAVGGLGRQIAERRQPRGQRALLLGLVPVAGERLFVGLEDDQALVAVDDHQVAAGDVGQERADADDRGNLHAFGDDRRVAAGAADLGDKAADELAVEVGRFAGREVVGQHDHRRGELRTAPRAAGPAGCAAAASRCRRCRWPARPGSCSRAS